MPVETAHPDIKVTTKPKKRTQTAVRLQPPYNVIIFNDDYHSMQFVAEVLCKVLGCTLDRAVLLMLQAHHTGRAIVWTGTKEVAELKVEQIRTFHETRDGDGAKLGPFDCTIEPAPGS